MIILFAVLLSLPGMASAQRLALSFDDGLDPRVQPQAATWNAALLRALATAQLRSILYPAGIHVDSPAGLALVRAWGEAGHAIGNHTYSHWNLAAPEVSAAAFITDAQRQENLVRTMTGWTARLRFPFLKEGDTGPKRDQVREWAAARGYRSGAVSIDASDWYYNARYLAWLERHPGDSARWLRDAYLAHLQSRARYYDSLSQRLFGRAVGHVLLLHTNAINAAFLPDVITMFKQARWTLIDVDAAYADALYSIQPAVLPAGESILWSIAKQKGMDGLRYPAEDDVYEKPLLDAADPDLRAGRSSPRR
jgi:peptidoglycan/xylan/chitin deacetylase (PgdA/CDA1 family)